jgi:hypothetical protein
VKGIGLAGHAALTAAGYSAAEGKEVEHTREALESLQRVIATSGLPRLDDERHRRLSR